MAWAERGRGGDPSCADGLTHQSRPASRPLGRPREHGPLRGLPGHVVRAHSDVGTPTSERLERAVRVDPGPKRGGVRGRSPTTTAPKVPLSQRKVWVPEPTRIHAQLPDGWRSTESGITNVPGARRAHRCLVLDGRSVFIDPCNQQTRADPPMMQTLDLLAGAFTGWWSPEAREDAWQPIASPAVGTTVSGFRARYLEIRIPAAVDMDRCRDGYVTWRNADNAPDNVQRRHTPGAYPPLDRGGRSRSQSRPAAESHAPDVDAVAGHRRHVHRRGLARGAARA